MFQILRLVSTHSRPKAAGLPRGERRRRQKVSTHSRPKAAGLLRFWIHAPPSRFNTQPPEGGWLSLVLHVLLVQAVSTHSRPKAAGIASSGVMSLSVWFQHTAARRRLGGRNDWRKWPKWFQHTAARRRLGRISTRVFTIRWFQHTAARRRLELIRA